MTKERDEAMLLKQPDGDRRITHLIVHCSATRENRNYSPEQLTKDHRARGFREAGYHYYIQRDGFLHRLRPLYKKGAHCRGHNAHSIGLCYEGGLDRKGKPSDTRTPAQREKMRYVATALKKRYPGLILAGHRDLSPDTNRNGRIEPQEWLKSCPCFDVQSEW